MTRPTVVCLCGSTRFYEDFQRANFTETMAGRIVLTVGFYAYPGDRGQTIGCTPQQKYMLDALHMCKIDMADEILVLNVGGYVGESTAREIEYAKLRGKKIRWLESNTMFLSPKPTEDRNAFADAIPRPRPTEYAGE